MLVSAQKFFKPVFACAYISIDKIESTHVHVYIYIHLSSSYNTLMSPTVVTYPSSININSILETLQYIFNVANASSIK